MSVRRRVRRDGTVAWDGRFRDLTGREISRTFSTKAEARRWANEQYLLRDRGVTVHPRGPETPFTNVANEWLTSNPSKSPKTLETDRRIVNTKLSRLAGKRVGGITRADVQSVVNEWATRGAPRSVARNFAVLRAIFNFALDSDLIAKSPCRNIKLPTVRKVVRPGTLTATDVRNLCDAVGSDYRALIALFAETGIRPSEAFALRVGHLRVLGSNPAIDIVVKSVEVAGRRHEGPPKSEAGFRSLAISATLVDEFAAHLARRGLDGGAPDAYVFAAPHGGALRHSNFGSRVWRPARKRADLAWATLYDLRRANTTVMFDLGVDISTVQKRLGQSDPRLAIAVYAQRSTRSDRAAADGMGTWLWSDDTSAEAERATNMRRGPSDPIGTAVAPG